METRNRIIYITIVLLFVLLNTQLGFVLGMFDEITNYFTHNYDSVLSFQHPNRIVGLGVLINLIYILLHSIILYKFYHIIKKETNKNWIAFCKIIFVIYALTTSLYLFVLGFGGAGGAVRF